ncbi:MAG: hypothetical protein A2V70_00520 [Planctomycetes bacterium RBG_13_63_9]|nr:MAG: hypothetical protein A2V70_00520 [Planctomycetes bacterium RBG_13_63_9]
MIAPIRETEAPPRSPGLRRAHRIVASTFLKKQTPPTDNGPPIPAWQSWLFTGWVVLVVAIYSAYMIGLL